MSKLLSLLMILLFVVTVVVNTMYSPTGLQKDAADMQNTTQTTIRTANTKIADFGK